MGGTKKRSPRRTALVLKVWDQANRSYLMLHCSETISSLSTLKVLPLLLPEVALPDGFVVLLALDDGLLLALDDGLLLAPLLEEALEFEASLQVPCTFTSWPTCLEKSSEPDSMAILPFFS